MDPRDPEPGDAPHGEPADGRFPAASGEPTAAAEPAARTAGEERRPGAPHRFRAWRGRRPFLGGLLMTLGGAEILVTERASLGVVVHVGMEGLSGYVVPTMLLVCGLLTLFNPQQRLFYSVLGVLLALGSWVTSNLGGFFVGLLLGLVGATLAFGWMPDQAPRRRLLRRSARQSTGGGAAGS